MSTLRKNKKGQYVITIGREKITRHLITPLTSIDGVEYLGYNTICWFNGVDNDYDKVEYYAVKVTDTYTAIISVNNNLNQVLKHGSKLSGSIKETLILS